jgi:DNA polymerase-1
MILTNTQFGYEYWLIENGADCDIIAQSAPASIGILAFDTETDTKIDMSNNDGSSIDIVHDRPFMIQFGWGSKIYIADLRGHDDAFKDRVLATFRLCAERAKLAIAHNIRFDINMLINIGFDWNLRNGCDSMSIARLALISKSEREGGYPMQLKPLAARLFGSQYADAGKEVDIELRKLWEGHLKRLMRALKPYKINRRMINDILKDVTSTLEVFPKEVQLIWMNWKQESLVSYADVPPDIMHRYGGTDAVLVLMLANTLLPIVKDKRQLDVLKREMRLIMPLVRMERTGYTVDKDYLIKSKQALIFEINAIREENRRIAGAEIGPSQHAAIKKLAKEKYGYALDSTDKNSIQIKIDSDPAMPPDLKKFLSNVLYLRTLDKWVATYINPIITRLNTHGDTKVYTQYNPNGAVSGRFTSNFQQFPKEAIKSRLGDFELFKPRKMFVIDADYPEMAYIDYSQVELRIQAEYTYYVTGGQGDVNMLRAYMPFKCHLGDDGKYYHDEDGQEWKGVDLHTQSTHNAFPDVPLGTPEFKKLRSLGKRVNFAMIYGASLRKVQETLADVPPETVARLYNGFNNAFKEVKTYGRYVSRTWNENRGYVTNLMGRRYYIDDYKDVYKLNNYLIQGSAADIMKAVIINVDAFLRKGHYKTRLQGCIHDELCICVAEGEHDVIYRIKDIMEHTAKTYVPLVAEISVTNTNWAEKGAEK